MPRNNENSFENFWSCDTVLSPRFFIREPADIYVPMHWHNSIEIIMLTNGRAKISVLDNIYSLCASDIVIINSHELHSTRSIGENSSYMMSIPDDFWQEHCPHIPLPRFHSIPDGDQKETLCEFMNTLAKYQSLIRKGGSFSYYCTLFSCMEYLLSIQMDSASDLCILSPEQSSRLDIIDAYIKDHYNEVISLETVASLLGLQTNYFCRVFKEITGRSFQQYLNEYRIYKIYADIVYSDDNVLDIMHRHGFSSERLFRKTFYSLFNATPSEIRKNHRSND